MILIFSLTAFLGAALLFVVQPMVGKLVLPVFGGVSSVWTVVMLFFTIILLFGYGYVVWLTKRPKKQQFILHGILIFITLGWLVVNFLGPRTFFSTQNIPFPNGPPVLSLLRMMLKVLALPCFLLATTSALLQSWYARLFSGKSPYWLYIVSNTGSLLGLLAYPFIIEPNLTLRVQQAMWVMGFILYVLLVLFITFLTSRKPKNIRVSLKPFRLNTNWAWFALPFVSTTAMLALTNQITQVISPIPFVWVATLGVYLLSFIFAFTRGEWYRPKFFSVLMLSFIGIAYVFTSGFINLKFQSTLLIALTTLFIIDLVCHRELFRRRPAPRGLTVYYLAISLGGVAASFFVGIIAPSIFSDIWEYPMVLVASVIAGICILFRSSHISFRLLTGALGLSIILLIGWIFIYNERSLADPSAETLASLRNFYGVLRVVKSGETVPYYIDLINGGIIHSNQLIGGSDENTPTTYYKRNGGLGYSILHISEIVKKAPLRIGMIGLGGGTAAAYCGSGDTIRFYEINPQVIEVARKYFTYLSNAEKAGCNVEIIEGDARISLEKELKAGRKGDFDVLAIDAFTGDSIPTHLLTIEATELYLSHLSDHGVIAFHITNGYLNLASVLKSMAGIEKLYFNDITTPRSHWVLMSRFSIGPQSYIPSLENIKIRPWTDDYSNILQALY